MKKTIPFTFPVFYLILTSRWGSHIQYGGIYLTDVLIVFSLATFFLKRRYRSNWSRKPNYFLYAFTAVIFVNSFFRFDFSKDWFRDAVPFLYLFIALLLARINLDRTLLQNSQRMIVISLRCHAIWYGFFSIFDFGNALPLVPGSQNIRLFEIRGDYDPMLCFVYLAWISYQTSRKLKLSKIDLISVAFAILGVGQSNSRAALLSFIIMIFIILVASKRLFTIALSLFAATFISLGLVYYLQLPIPGVVSKLPFSNALLNNSQSEELRNLGDGTSRSRFNAWVILLNYVTEDPARTMVGVGPGRDFMSESGAGRALIANFNDLENAPRSPHNIIITVLVRFGLVGMFFFIALLIQVWLQLRSGMKSQKPEDIEYELDSLKYFLFVGILVTSTLGVILESPFGAIPFAWLLGVSASFRTPRT